ncbi:metal-chelation protein CHAD [Campylobacter gastrosuis]|uniref:Metal-chelation protein CHAD n=1 Tax=Campylobacter gastrosuis TaxID=2974576 RepID=A0ABT7HSQ5_9BACT|nr:metal-chelation protein CHAD [Campylobacter gastrosuis]MDL0089453.1 metal-chelation protein CHAD [Campylobacter gastrosuis]
MGVEIERKFLLKDDGLLKFLNQIGVNFKRYEIVQFYTKISKNAETRYRKIGDNYTKTTKIGTGITRKEFENTCEKTEFETALSSQIGEVLNKERFEFRLNNNDAFIDVFSGDLSGLFTLEVEFKDELYGVFFRLKEPILSHILKDVSDDANFKNKSLALFGLESKKSDLEFAKNVLKQHKIPINFTKNITAKDALSLAFFQILDDFDKSEPLKFIKTAQKCLVILEFLPEIFDTKLSQNFCENFKILSDFAKVNLELDECLKHTKNAKITPFLKDALEICNANLAKFLNEKSTEFLAEWELFLNEDSDFFSSKNANEKLIKLLSFQTRVKFIELRRALRALNQDNKNDEFYKIEKILSEIFIVFSSFETIFNDKNVQKFSKKLGKFHALFNSLNTLDTLLKATLSYISDEKKSQKISAKTYEKIYKIRNKIIKKREKFLKQLQKVVKILRIYG